VEDVAARGYNLDLKNPHIADRESHDPDELLARYAAQQGGIQSLRDQLKVVLADALAGGA
jgi:type I restriction enzyme M protein